jgi:hypothetical protein
MSSSNNPQIVYLDLYPTLKEKGIVTEFVYYRRDNLLKISVNHKVKPFSLTITLDKKNWIENAKNIKKRLKPMGVDKEIIDLLGYSLDHADNVEKIYGMKEQHNNNYNIDTKYCSLSGTYDNVKNSNNNSAENNGNSLKEKQKQEQQQEEESELSYKEWSQELEEKYYTLQKEILNLIPELWEPVEFALSVSSILRIKNITLPFAGIILGPPSSLKTAAIELFRNTKDTYYTDNFSAKSFVSHNTSVPREKLVEIDLLPKIKDKLFLTPEMSPTFSKKDEELNEILGIITRVLDGHGYESDTGAQGHRGYNGEFMFVWIGAAVDIPRKIHRLLGTLGPKLYFFRIKNEKKDEEFYLKQIQNEDIDGNYIQKIERIKLKLNDYLEWFDLKPNHHNNHEEQEIKDNNEENVLRCIIRLANLLAHLRGYVPVWETKDSQGSDYAYTFPTIEEPSRAITQLKNLARGHALSLGRNHIMMEDIPLLIKVVLSTASKERVILFDHLLENNGKLDTLSISEHMIVGKKTALKTMTELVILEIVDRLDMDNSINNNNNNAFQIQLKHEFNWFLSDEFKNLRANFGDEYYNEYVGRKEK